MADTNETGSTVGKTSNPVQTETTENAIPYARFKEVNEKAKDLEAQLKARDDADKKAREAKLLEEKKYSELIEQRNQELVAAKQREEALVEKNKVFEERQLRLREQALEKIKDEGLKQIASKLPDVDDVLAFVEKLSITTKESPFGGKGGVKHDGADNPFVRLPGETYNQYQARVQKIPAGQK